MDLDKKLTYLLNIVSEKVTKIRPKFVKTRKKAINLKICIIIFSVLTTMILGLDLWRELAVVASSAVIVLNGLDSLFSYSKKSTQEHSYYLELSMLKDKIQYYKEFTQYENYDKSKIDGFFEEFNEIRRNHHKERIDTVINSFEQSNYKLIDTDKKS